VTTEPDKPKVTANPIADVGKWLAGSFVLVTSVVTLLGIATDSVGRILLNHPWWLFTALVLLVLAIVLGAMTPLVEHERRRRKVLYVVGAAVALVCGLALLDVAASKSAADNQRPKISMAVSGGQTPTSAKGTVTATGLTTKEHLLLEVWGLSSGDELASGVPHSGHPADGDPPPDRASGEFSQLLFASRTGPDPSGKVDLPFELPIGAGLYQRLDVHARVESVKGADEFTPCNGQSARLACETVWLPPAGQRPHLAASWAASGRVTAAVSANGIAADDQIALAVHPLRHGRLRSALYVGRFAAEKDGSVSEKVDAAVPKSITKVCVVAKLRSAHGVPLKARRTRRCGKPDPVTSTTRLTR
jgi:hypothetical protein